MINRIFRLFKIARKLSTSGAIETINQIHNLPIIINIFFNIISIGSEKKLQSDNKKPGEKLCAALESMGTTFIKLGQFLATRPDILGEELAKNLEKLQDKVPAFDTYQAKKIIKKVIPPNAGFETSLQRIIVFSLSRIPRVLENFKSIVLITKPNKVIQTKNSE